MSSRGEMKISLKLMIFALLASTFSGLEPVPYILVPEMFEKLQLPVGSFGKDRSTEGFHDLFDGDGLTGELVFRGAARSMSEFIRS